MGTRSLTRFYESVRGGEPLVTVYRQYDGYLSGHGVELAEFLSDRFLTNGIRGGQTSKNAANGMGCLAAQFIRHFKGDDIGNIYIMHDGDHGQDYEYEVRPNRHGDGFRMKVMNSRKEVLFSGDVEDFDPDKE